MTALLRTRGSTSEMARLFEADATRGLRWSPTIWPGEAVPVVVMEGDRRSLLAMTWGLPRGAFARPVPDAQRGTLYGRDLVQDASRLSDVTGLQRCLIIVESFAYPAGLPGSRTRSWIGLWDAPLAAWAGYCSADGTACAGMLVRADDAVAHLTDTMPRLLRPGDHAAWLAGVGLLGLGAGYHEKDFYREDLGERWSSGQQDHATLPLCAA